MKGIIRYCEGVDCWRLAIVAFFLAAASAGSVGAKDVREAFEWREYTYSGPFTNEGRPIDSKSMGIIDIDINSKVSLRFDKSVLGRALGTDTTTASGQWRQLRVRMDAIRKLTADLKQLPEQLDDLFRATDSLAENNTASNRKILDAADSIFGASAKRVINSLYDLVERRLESQQGDPEGVVDMASALLDNSIYIPGGYGWGFMRQQYAIELDYLDESIDALISSTDFQVLVEGYYYHEGRNMGEIPLAGYNTVVFCEASPFQKMRTSMSEDEQTIHNSYVELAQDLNNTRDAADRILRVIESLYPDARQAVDSFRTAIVNLEQSAKGLSRWKNPDTVRAWLSEVGNNILASPSGITFEAALVAVMDESPKMLEDLETIKGLADSLLSGSGADRRAAVRSLLPAVAKTFASSKGIGAVQLFSPETWERRIGLVRELIEASVALGEDATNNFDATKAGPLGDLVELDRAIQSLLDTSKEELTKAAQFFGRLVSSGIAASELSQLPDSPSQPRGLNDQIDTEFNLLTLCHERHERDIVRLSASFWLGDQLLGRKYEYDFRVRIFGWQSNLYSSLAISQRQGRANWRYNAPISFIVKYNRWEDDGNWGRLLDGLTSNGFVSGIGFSTITLDDEDNKTLELGVGPTLALLNDRVLLGLGWNLDAETDRRYAFVSFRFVDLSRQVGLSDGKR